MCARKASPRLLVACSLLWLGLGSSAGAVVIDFDGLSGKPGPWFGKPCEPEFQVDDEYSGLGVFFSSNDTAVCVLDAPPSAVSNPNVVTGVTTGDVDFGAPLIAKFFDGGNPGAVALVTVHLTDDSQAGVEARDVNGLLLGDSGKFGDGVHVLSFPNRIHEVRVAPIGTYALDDFSFSPIGAPQTIPALRGGGLLGLALLLVGAWALRPGLQH